MTNVEVICSRSDKEKFVAVKVLEKSFRVGVCLQVENSLLLICVTYILYIRVRICWDGMKTRSGCVFTSIKQPPSSRMSQP